MAAAAWKAGRDKEAGTRRERGWEEGEGEGKSERKGKGGGTCVERQVDGVK